MPKSPKLKVYCTPVGFYDALVAAPSQKAALRAWGTSTDLFGAGRASVVGDPAKQKQALARPGEVIKVARAGEAEMLAEIEREDAKRPRPPKHGHKAAPAKAPPPPDRSKLDAAERALADAEREHAERLDALAAERAELDARVAALGEEGELNRRRLSRTREEAQRAFDLAVKKSRRT